MEVNYPASEEWSLPEPPSRRSRAKSREQIGSDMLTTVQVHQTCAHAYPATSGQIHFAALAASFIRKDTAADTSTPRLCGCPVDAPARSSPWTTVHDIIHWPDGGRTEVDNLVLH
jgi:hypothetical protein